MRGIEIKISFPFVDNFYGALFDETIAQHIWAELVSFEKPLYLLFSILDPQLNWTDLPKGKRNSNAKYVYWLHNPATFNYIKTRT